MNVPRKLTMRVLNGILAATSEVLSGPEDGEMEEDWADVKAANAWAHEQRALMKAIEREQAALRRKAGRGSS